MICIHAIPIKHQGCHALGVTLLGFSGEADAMFTSFMCLPRETSKYTSSFGIFKEACAEGCIALSCPNHLACFCAGKQVHSFPLPMQSPEGCVWFLWLQGTPHILEHPRHLGMCQADLTKFKKYLSSSRSGSLTDCAGRCPI